MSHRREFGSRQPLDEYITSRGSHAPAIATKKALEAPGGASSALLVQRFGYLPFNGTLTASYASIAYCAGRLLRVMAHTITAIKTIMAIAMGSVIVV